MLVKALPSLQFACTPLGPPATFTDGGRVVPNLMYRISPSKVPLMKMMLTLAAFVVLTLGSSSMTPAVSISFYLNVDANGPGTWTLTGSTDAVGGIASYVVDLINVDIAAVRRGPRFNGPQAQSWGFVFGGNLVPQATGGLQASGGQNMTGEAVDDLGNVVKPLVYGIGAPGGYINPPDTTLVHVSSTGNPLQVPVELHRGTYNIFGPLPAFAPIQPTQQGAPHPGAVWTSVGQLTPITGADGLIAVYLPEPGAIVLFATAVPALILVIHRRRAARRRGEIG
jgi:hypothetical protein